MGKKRNRNSNQNICGAQSKSSSKTRKKALDEKKVVASSSSSLSSSSSSRPPPSSFLTNVFGSNNDTPSSINFVSSIFGNNGTRPPRTTAGLTTSTPCALDMFSTKVANKLSKVTKDRMKANKQHLQDRTTTNVISISANCERGKAINYKQNEVEEKETILKKRKNTNFKQHSINAIQSISVSLPDFIDDDYSEFDYYEKKCNNVDGCNHENDNVTNGIVKLFTNQADAIMRENGVLILKTNITKQDHQNKRIFHPKLLKSMSQKAKEIENDICKRLDEKGRIWQQQIQHKNKNNTSQLEEDHAFQYHEVASRCFGRLDVRYKMNQVPFSNKNIISNPYILPIMKSLLGSNVVLVYAGLILSFPNSADQPWHQDGTRLFDENDGFTSDMHLPPYAMNVFIPLDDVTYDVGPTEFYIGSHFTDKAKRIMEKWHGSSKASLIGSNSGKGDKDSDDVNNDKPIGPLLQCGDVLIYDYRVCHRGTRNLSTDKTRPMLYLMYARPWFQEHLNFGNERLFDEQNKM